LLLAVVVHDGQNVSMAIFEPERCGCDLLSQRESVVLLFQQLPDRVGRVQTAFGGDFLETTEFLVRKAQVDLFLSGGHQISFYHFHYLLSSEG
jgi:hypothetical protein